MCQRTIYRILTLATIIIVSTTAALGQSSSSSETLTTGHSHTSWQGAAGLAGSSKEKLFVVTTDKPDRRQTCHVQSFTEDKLVCSRAVGGPRTYLPQQIVALIRPGDGNLTIKLFLGFNAGLGAAIWGTVVLAAVCPPCAVATGVAALFFFGAAGASLIGDDVPDSLLYLAPGQQLSTKLGLVQS